MEKELVLSNPDKDEVLRLGAIKKTKKANKLKASFFRRVVLIFVRKYLLLFKEYKIGFWLVISKITVIEHSVFTGLQTANLEQMLIVIL